MATVYDRPSSPRLLREQVLEPERAHDRGVVMLLRHRRQEPEQSVSRRSSLFCTQTMMQHLPHPPPFPTGNQYLQQKFDKESYDLHRRKVKSMTSSMNITPPKTYAHLALKMKNQKLEEETTRQKYNVHKEKISQIMRTSGAVDNRNDYEKKSLGKEKRQRELLRITEENQLILNRLGQCRPQYNLRSWHDDWLKSLKLRDSITRYPARANTQKGQEKPSKQRDCDEEQT